MIGKIYFVGKDIRKKNNKRVEMPKNRGVLGEKKLIYILYSKKNAYLCGPFGTKK